MKLIRIPDKFPMLFDLSKDISEKHDIVLEQKKIADEMIEMVGTWYMNCPQPLFFPSNRGSYRSLYDEVGPPQPEFQDD